MSVVNLFADRSLDSDRVILTLLDHMIWPILALTVVGVLLTVPQTLGSYGSIRLLLWGSVALGLLVLAESICLLSGNFDLSIGSIAGFSAMFTGMLLGSCPSCWGIISNPILGIVIVLGVGALIGFGNGILIGKYDQNPFLITLSFLIIFEGARRALNTQPVSGLPDGYTYVGAEPLVAIGILIAMFALFVFVMNYTRFGRAVYAVGSNEKAAREVGIDTSKVILLVFMISGALSGMAGLMITGFTGVVPPLIGEGMVFQAFAGAVIGGISLFGGRGNLSGALGGVILISLVESALNNSPAVGATEIQLFNGIVLLVAILLYSMQSQIRARILSGGAE